VSYERPLRVAVAAAREAGAVLQAEFHRPGGPRGGGGHCAADAQAEALIRDRLGAEFPQYGMRGEELDRDCPPQDAERHVWVIDPNDGTAAFLKGHRGPSVSIALLRNGLPVLGVVFAYAAPDDNGDLFAWAEGCGPMSRNGRPVLRPAWADALTCDQTVIVSQDADHNSFANGELAAPARFRAVASVAYRLALVAAGEGEAAVSLVNARDWDYAAGHALLRAAGGELLGANGNRVTYTPEGRSDCGGRCFGGSPAISAALAGRDWGSALHGSVPPQRKRFELVWPEPGMNVSDAGLLDRAAGCLLGQLCGDALGSLVEFRDADTIKAANPQGVRVMHDGGHWVTLGGQPTDDSEMALMLARSIVAGGRYDPRAAAEGYAWWYDSRPFDMGMTTSIALCAASAALRGGGDPVRAARSAANVSSQANGALMRVSPLGVYAHAMDAEALAQLARADAELTHPHPVCGDANSVFAVAIAHALRTGDGPKQVFRFAADWAASHKIHTDVRLALAAAEIGPPVDYFTKMGWVLIALQNAFHRLLHSANVEEAIVDTIMCGGDTDTTGAIAGALLGAVHGARSIPLQWRDRVLTCRAMKGLARVYRPRPRNLWAVDAPLLAERLLVLGKERP
jgi:ADP-ribosylglycohydrolase/fructose-1,6-bisphosphatase/inositol monophosphatase family enzyme